MTPLIALDWGTSSLRAYRLAAGGRVLDSRSLKRGVMHLASAGEAGFEQALDEACGDWLEAEPGTPMIACGMVGSAQGWREAAYVPAPLAADALAGALTRIPTRRGTLHVIPGVIQPGALPNLMRGEETQVFGLLAEALRDTRQPPALIGLPGSHSKWVQVEAGRLAAFHTFMTGEVYAALLEHTILGRTAMVGGGFDRAAFTRGLGVAWSADGRGGPLSAIFSSRALVLTGALSGRAQADYLSGLLIGYEVAAMSDLCAVGSHQPIVLIGSSALCARYLCALEQAGYGAVRFAPEATTGGLWLIAQHAGLVDSRQLEEA